LVACWEGGGIDPALRSGFFLARPNIEGFVPVGGPQVDPSAVRTGLGL